MATNRNRNRSGSISDQFSDRSLNSSDLDSEPQTPKWSSPPAKKGLARRSSILLAEDPFGSDESKLLFDAIDQLRSCGAGQDLDLPQLVIVGKQSVGKSSLLESLTEIPFPVGDNLCTRFATRIISRRTPPGTPDMINVSVEKGDIDHFDDSTIDSQIGTFKPTIQHPMDAENFREVIDQASRAMGIIHRRKGEAKNFSSNVLKIELSGPGRSHFGILDLPGIFGAATRDVTEKERVGVDNMVMAYMKKRENIIIVVADTDDLANQRILTLAAEHVENERLVGVITKCDRAAEPERIVEIVQTNEGTSGKPLHHGWFVVRNRGQKDDPVSFDREKAERTMFSKGPWVNIEERRRGTAKLKSFLSNLLCRRIREGFPGMQTAVQCRLAQEKERLHRLGEPRGSHNLRMAYLFGITQRFQNLVEQALRSPEDLPFEDLKLRGKIERAKDEFAENLRLHGHLYDFSAIREAEVEQFVEHGGHGPLHNGVTGGKSGRDTKKGRALYDEIKRHINANQGMELRGMVNPAVLKPLLKMQASKWEDLAKEHLERLAHLTNEAVLGILKLACEDLGAAPYTREELERLVLKFATNARKRALEELSRQCRQEFTHHLQTSNPAFINNVKEAQLLRFGAALDRYTQRHPPETFLVNLSPKKDPMSVGSLPHVYQSWAIISPDTIGVLFAEMHSHTEQNTQDEIHDLLKAYYEVAREDFISYVNRRIAEPFLNDEAGPVFGLCVNYISSLTDEQIEDLGGEHDSTIKARQTIQATIARLEAAEEIAQQTLRKTRALVEL